MRTASVGGGKSRLSFSPDGARHQQQQEASRRSSGESEPDSAAHPLLDAAQHGDDDDGRVIRAPAGLSHQPSLSAAAAAAAAGVEASGASQHLMPNLLLPEEELLECLRATSFTCGRHNAAANFPAGSSLAGLAPCSPGASTAGAVLTDRMLPPTPSGCCHSNLRVVSAKHAVVQQEASPHAAGRATAGFSSSGSSSSRDLLEGRDHLITQSHSSQRQAASPAASAAVHSRTGSCGCTGSRHSSGRPAAAAAPADQAEVRDEDAEARLLADMGICLGNLQAAARLARTDDSSHRVGGAVKRGRQSSRGQDTQQQQQQQHGRQTFSGAADADGCGSNASKPSPAPLAVGSSQDGVVLLTVGIAAAASAAAATAAGGGSADYPRQQLLKSSAAAAGLQQQPVQPGPSSAGVISGKKRAGVLHWLQQLMHGSGSRAGEQQSSKQQQLQAAELPTPVERIRIISRITRSSDVGDEQGASRDETATSWCQGRTGEAVSEGTAGSSSCQPALLPRPPQQPPQQPLHRNSSARVIGVRAHALMPS